MDSINAVLRIGQFGLNVEYAKALVSSENIKGMAFDSYVGLAIDTKSLKADYWPEQYTVGSMSEFPTARTIRDQYSDGYQAKVSPDEEVIKLVEAELRHRVIADMLSKKIALFELATTYKG